MDDVVYDVSVVNDNDKNIDVLCDFDDDILVTLPYTILIFEVIVNDLVIKEVLSFLREKW